MTLFVTKNGQQLGPYSLGQVQDLVANGTLVASDWAWYEGLTDWIQITQIPGFVLPITTFAGTGTSQPTRTERPVLVWVICIFFFVCIPFSLISLALIPLMANGTIPVADAQRHYFESQNYFDYAILVLNPVIVLTWAIQFFRLKRMSFYIYLGMLALGAFMLIYNMIAKDWIATVGTIGLIGAGVGWILNLAILYYNWHLFRKGVLT